MTCTHCAYPHKVHTCIKYPTLLTPITYPTCNIMASHDALPLFIVITFAVVTKSNESCSDWKLI